MRQPRAPTSLPTWFPDELKPLLAQEFAAFSDAEMDRRMAAVEDLMQAAGAQHVFVYGANKVGTAPHWLTGWPTTAEAALVHTPGVKDKLWVQWVNHVGLASRMAKRCDVAWGGPVNNTDSTLRNALDELARRGAKPGTVAVIGPMTWTQLDLFAEKFGKPINLNGGYGKLRLVKSAEEIDWLRVGAAFCDAAIFNMMEHVRPGLTEHELGAIVDGSYVGWGGSHGIHFMGVTSMENPDSFVPTQFTAPKPVRAGDCVVTEISAYFWDYGGQVLRSFAVGAAPTPLYRDLHATASAAFDAIFAVMRPGCTPAEIVDAAGVIEEAGFTICDDLVHGYGGGYLQPVLGCKSRPNGPLPDMVLQEGMCLVIQPNVVTPDHKAGVQTGELVTITRDGARSLHQAPRGFLRI